MGYLKTAGQTFYDEVLDEVFEVNASMPEEVLQRFLKSKKAVHVVFGYYDYTYKLKTKRGKWYAYYEGRKLNKRAADSIALYGEVWDNYTLIIRKGSYTLHGLDSGDVSPVYEGLRAGTRSVNTPVILAKQNKLWGQLGGGGQWIQPNVFERWEDVPLVTGSYIDIEAFVALRELLSADVVLPDPNNGDGIYKVRNADSKLWGMYQYLSTPDTLIPMEYDSLDFFYFNGAITPVYRNGKVGFYAWGETGQTVPCRYDGYEKKWYKWSRTSPEMFYMLVQRDGKWGVVDWWTGEELTPFEADTKEGVKFKVVDSAYYDW